MKIPAVRTPWAVIVALFVTCLIPAEGASVRRMQLDEVRDHAVSVFWGQVTDRSTRIGTEGKMVWTDYEISVSEHLRGTDPGIRTTVSFAGGTAGHLSIGIPGVPHLTVGDTYIFFLQEGTLRPAATVGWGQGLFRVERVDLGGTMRNIIVSYDGEPLQMTPDGTLARGALVRVENGGVWDLSLLRDPSSPRMPDPVFTDGSGRAVERQATPVPQATPLLERHFATLDDLRMFVDGRIAADRGGQR